MRYFFIIILSIALIGIIALTVCLAALEPKKAIAVYIVITPVIAADLIIGLIGVFVMFKHKLKL